MLGSRKNITDALKVQLGYRVKSKVSVCSAKIETNSPILKYSICFCSFFL